MSKPDWLPLPRDEQSFWNTMSQDFAIDCDEDNPYVQKQIRWYQQHPKHLARVLKTAEPFLHYVFEQTHRKNLPAELALIPIIESQYNPSVGASSGAAGLWQMMPGTATKFGLRINHTYDGRRDVPASTKAALTYLSYLYKYFNNDWLLALAAYECGEGNVQSVAGRYKSFWNLPLYRSTKEYVPKLLAISYIIKDPQRYHIKLPWMSNRSNLHEMVWNEANVINVADTARSLGVDNFTLRHYNPGLIGQIAKVPRTFTLLVPGQSYITMQPATENPVLDYDESSSTSELVPNKTSDPLPETKLLEEPQALLSYQIRKRDTLDGIAKKYHTTTAQLKKLNHLSSNHLKIGKKLKIPAVNKKPQTLSSRKAHPLMKKYTIKQGDSLSSIAHRHHITLKQLKYANKLTYEKQLKIGSTLTIPTK